MGTAVLVDLAFDVRVGVITDLVTVIHLIKLGKHAARIFRVVF